MSACIWQKFRSTFEPLKLLYNVEEVIKSGPKMWEWKLKHENLTGTDLFTKQASRQERLDEHAVWAAWLEVQKAESPGGRIGGRRGRGSCWAKQTQVSSSFGSDCKSSCCFFPHSSSVRPLCALPVSVLSVFIPFCLPPLAAAVFSADLNLGPGSVSMVMAGSKASAVQSRPGLHGTKHTLPGAPQKILFFSFASALKMSLPHIWQL